MKKYDVSVIVPVYNSSKYLDDCIKSLINQTYGFENIELVLVNDGSKDNSLEICKNYQKKYNNIVIIDKENSGVSDTRNTGFEKSSGKYVMFLDSDDLINKDSIKYLSKFLDENDNVDFVISRVRMFEKTNKWHYMDYRFKDDKKFININEDITYSQYHSTGILIRRTVIVDIRFDRTIKYGEDMKFMSQILLKNEVYGKEKRSILYYRKRFDETSAVQKQTKDKDFYIKTLKDSFKFIFDEVEKKYKSIPKYYQYYILNSLVERFEIEYEGVLTKSELSDYVSLFTYFIKKIDDDVIMMQKRTGFNQKYYLLKLKHGDKYKIKVDYKDNKIMFNDEEFKHKISEFIRIFKIEKVDKKLVFYMYKNDYLFDKKIDVFVDNKLVEIKQIKDKNIEIKKYRDASFNVFYEEKVESFEVDFDKVNSICFKINGESLTYALTKDFITYNLSTRYIKIDGVLIVFKKFEIKFYRKNIMPRFIKYYYVNRKKLRDSEEHFEVFVKNGKITKKNRKVY